MLPPMPPQATPAAPMSAPPMEAGMSPAPDTGGMDPTQARSLIVEALGQLKQVAGQYGLDLNQLLQEV